MCVCVCVCVCIIVLSHFPFLVSVCAALLLPVTHRGSLLGGSMRVERGGQRLAYDGIYDTPPVTWYYSASEGNSKKNLESPLCSDFKQ